MILFLTENKNIENYSVSSTPKQIDEIEELKNSIPDNISKEIKVSKDVLDSFDLKSELNPKLWEGDKLKSVVRTKLVKIANDFFKELNLPENVKMKDIIFTGSLANFNWSKFSDIDLHIVLDFDSINGDQQFKEDFFRAQKTVWNNNHDITIYDYPVELYAQDRTAKLAATSIYSVKNDKWVLKPEKETFKPNKAAIKQKAERFINQLKTIKADYDNNDLESVVSKSEALKSKIKNYRSSGLESGGEFSLENLVFKVLRRTPYMEILNDLKAKAYDKKMSVKESVENKNLIKETLRGITEAIVKATEADLYRTMFLVAKANSLYGPNSELTDDFDKNTRDYLNSPNMGQGEIIYKVNERGLPYIWTSPYSGADISKNDLGSRGSNQVHKQFGIRVMPGIEHPEDRQERTGNAATRKGLTGSEKKEVFTFNLPDGVVTSKGKNFLTVKLDRPGSPASDGVIKLYLLHGQEIIDYVRTYIDGYNAYTSHGDAEKLSKEKMAADPKLEKHKQRKDAIIALQQHLGRRPLEAEIQKYIETGNLPEKGGTKSLYDPEELARREKERQAAMDRINRARNRNK